MYRAIICVGFGELKGPNPLFRTKAACEAYWLAKMYEYGPAIESFVPVKVNREVKGDKMKLIGDVMKLRQKVEPMTFEETDEVFEIMYRTSEENLDLCMAHLVDSLWHRKQLVKPK